MLYKYEKRDVKPPKPRRTRVKRSRGSLVFTMFCFILGLSLLSYAAFPYAKNYVMAFSEEDSYSKSLLTPSPSQSASLETGNGDAFNTDYLSNVSKNFSATNRLLHINQRTHPEYAHISGQILLSIPRLELVDLPIQINVNSFSEDDYLPVLKHSLAHFKGTSLPDKPGNTFIYGHSANVLLAKTAPKSPVWAFSFLDKLDIGDEIFLTYKGKVFTYTMTRSKLVNPDDISPIYTTSNDQVLTLMTCWVPGVGNQRLIINARLVEERSV